MGNIYFYLVYWVTLYGGSMQAVKRTALKVDLRKCSEDTLNTIEQEGDYEFAIRDIYRDFCAGKKIIKFVRIDGIEDSPND